MPGPESDQSTPTRRRFLATAAGLGAVSSSGCASRARSILNRESPSTVAVEIKTPPADNDRAATLIARHLKENLNTVGVDATLDFLPPVELYREVLLNGNFDAFVSRLPPLTNPDQLRTLLHSVFAEEAGWQNPYSFADLTADGYLDEQRTEAGVDRRTLTRDVIEMITREQPLTAVAHPDAIRAVRSERFSGWHQYPPRSPLSYFALNQGEQVDGEGSEAVTLRLSTTDSRLTRNLNPLAVEFRDTGTFMQFLYEPLMYREDDERIPWLAERWDWDPSGTTTARVQLRPDLRWHDGVSLTAADVAFTYRFLKDTSLGDVGTTVPAPIYRGRSTLAEEVIAEDDRTLRFSFGDVTPQVAERALTVPILPRHIWREQTDQANVPGVTAQNVTEALVWSNEEPVGSGPFEFERVAVEEALYLRRSDDHFLSGDPPDDLAELLDGGLAFDRFELRVVPSDATAVELLAAGDLDATTATVGHQAVPKIGEEGSLSLLVDRANTPYHVGYNTGTEPFSNPRFRRLVASLIDKEHLVSDVVGGYGAPIAHPLDDTHWNPPGSGFREQDPEVPFLGENGDVDVERAREAFRDRGFEFDENGQLMVQ
jgi:peptide/nickel transport system substrate-binding protein